MEIVTEFAYKVREIEHCLIPLKDGTQLAARIWLPEVAGLQTFGQSWSTCRTANAMARLCAMR